MMKMRIKTLPLLTGLFLSLSVGTVAAATQSSLKGMTGATHSSSVVNQELIQAAPFLRTGTVDLAFTTIKKTGSVLKMPDATGTNAATVGAAGIEKTYAYETPIDAPVVNMAPLETTGVGGVVTASQAGGYGGFTAMGLASESQGGAIIQKQRAGLLGAAGSHIT